MTAPTVTDGPQLFDPAMVDGLPTAARRWLRAAIAPGTPLQQTAHLRQHGAIKIGCWQRFEADWLLHPPHEFIWSARTRLGPVRIEGFDRYADGAGEMDWRLFGRVPILRASGPDVSRSALGRLAAEFCFVPGSALSPLITWASVDEHRAVARVVSGEHTHAVRLTVGKSGALLRVDLARWGNPGGGAFREHLFSAVMQGGRQTFDGYTIPVAARAGWWFCPDRCARSDFIQFSIDRAVYL